MLFITAPTLHFTGPKNCFTQLALAINVERDCPENDGFFFLKMIVERDGVKNKMGTW